MTTALFPVVVDAKLPPGHWYFLRPGQYRLSRGERAAACALRAQARDEAIRELDEIHRDDAAVQGVLEIVGWLW